MRAFEDLTPYLEPITEAEIIPADAALDRIVADEIMSPEDLPQFARSSMDGYSVRARDTFGALESLPAILEVVADIPTGTGADVRLKPGEAAVAYTGGMLAGEADAVVMIERTQPADERSIEVLRPVAPGENVVQVGEDVRAGDLILDRGHRLRPQDIGGLMALGITTVPVVRRPRVAIISTGDELVEPGVTPPPGRIRDINTYSVAARVTECGGEPITGDIVPDEYDAQLNAARAAIKDADILVFSAGSSLSTRDMTARVFTELGDPGVILHGISVKPGKPTIVGVAGGKPLFGLPGNPVSALIVFDLIVAPAIGVLSGARAPARVSTLTAILADDVPSETGREDHVPVRITGRGAAAIATPVFGKSNLIYTLVKADGVVRVPAESGGLYAGETVNVRMFGS